MVSLILSCIIVYLLCVSNISKECECFSFSASTKNWNHNWIYCTASIPNVEVNRRGNSFLLLKSNVEEIPTKDSSCTLENDSSLDDSTLDFGLSDDEFRSWLMEEMKNSPGRKTYKLVFDQAIEAIIRWRQRYRGNPKLWKRIFKKERVLKELVESVPIIHSVQTFVLDNENIMNDPYTILDLCSGKGYLSMFLSEILPSEKVQKIILIDKAWPMCNAKELLPHHINWDHIYGTIPPVYGGTEEQSQSKDPSTYFTTWPIPLHTSKQNLKQSCNQRQMKKYLFDQTKGPILILAVHLCGTLSLKAVNLFNGNPNVKLFALKPCCLPQMVHAQRKEEFHIGKHSFPAVDVCANGSFNKKFWNGPPRKHLETKFQLWSDHLYQGIDVVKEEQPNVEASSSSLGQKEKREIPIQVDGGFQNTYLIAERSPLTKSLWIKPGNE